MQSRYRNTEHSQTKSQSIFFSTKKILLLTAISASLFVALSSKNIKAQIASIISEDGDGLVGITSLMNATISNDLQSVQFFAKNGGSQVVNQKNIGGATALHIASRNNSPEIIKALIENGANVNLTDNEGWTPLMRATISNSPDSVGILLDAGADASKMNSIGETAIVHAASSECPECLEQIFSKYNFAQNLDYQTLKNQIGQSMEIANNKNNVGLQEILKDYAKIELSKVATSQQLESNPNNNNQVLVRSLDEQPMRTPFGVDSIPNIVSLGLPARTHNYNNSSVVMKPNNQRSPYKLVTKESNISDEVVSDESYSSAQENSKTKYKFLGKTKPYLPGKVAKSTKVNKAKSTNTNIVTTKSNNIITTNDNGSRSLSSSIKDEAAAVVDEVKSKKYNFTGEIKATPQALIK